MTTTTNGEIEMRTAASDRIARLRAPSPEDIYPYALQLGVRLGLGLIQLQALREVARYHDIGKRAIPLAILAKPGKLDPDELEFARSHSAIGARILHAHHETEELAPLVRASHERWDGAGYPDRLAGEEIPLVSRIIAVCDAFVAMTSPRPYRATMNEQQALLEIARHAGTQFDPNLAREFQRMMTVSEQRVA